MPGGRLGKLSAERAQQNAQELLHGDCDLVDHDGEHENEVDSQSPEDHFFEPGEAAAAESGYLFAGIGLEVEGKNQAALFGPFRGVRGGGGVGEGSERVASGGGVKDGFSPEVLADEALADSNSRIAGTIALVSVLEMIFRTPAICASNSSCLEACIVHIRIGVWGSDFEIFRAAVRPSITGMARSRTTASG